ncbi:MAG: hypothetical protein WBP57_10985 [Ignavibacteria bacterium]
MKNIEDRAFPMQYADDSYQQGMSLRDYFAAKAMQGFCVAFPGWSDAEIARAAYKQADAMLEARK